VLVKLGLPQPVPLAPILPWYICTTDNFDPCVQRPVENHPQPSAMSMTRALTKPETWCLIGTFLNTSDLNELCQTCRSLLHALRPFLFRDLNLTLEMEYKDLTLKLLCTNKRLASHVQTFNFNESEDELDYYALKKVSKSHDLFIKAIGNMSRLHTLRLNDVVFASTSEENKFLDQIQNHRIPLRTFDFHAKVADDFTGSSKKGHLQSSSFPLANLTSLIWVESGDDDGSDDGKPLYYPLEYH
jgi:hypothetical protein